MNIYGIMELGGLGFGMVKACHRENLGGLCVLFFQRELQMFFHGECGGLSRRTRRKS